jgi:hypothetical protein
LVNNSLTIGEKDFLRSYIKGEPDWKYFDYSNFPAINWKLQNINKLKQEKPDKYRENLEKLENLLHKN